MSLYKSYECTEWNPEFFDEFVRFGNSLYPQRSLLAQESLEYFQKIFCSHYYRTSVTYSAFLLKKSGEVCARVVFFVLPDQKTTLNVGFLETQNDEEAILQLKALLESKLTEDVAMIKGPIQGHFFLSYRMKIEGGAESFWGEPDYPNFYRDVFHKLGLTEEAYWDTIEISNRKVASKKFTDIKKKKIHHKYKVKYIFPWRWNRYIESIHELFHKTYAKMPEFSALPLDLFREFYDDYRPLINPFMSYLVLNGDDKPIGFCINYFDPQHVLEKVQRPLGKWQKIWLFLRLVFNFRRLLIVYVGKDESFGPLKGFQASVSPFIKLGIFLFRPKQIFVCYQAEGNQSRKSFAPEASRPVSRYALFSKTLTQKERNSESKGIES